MLQSTLDAVNAYDSDLDAFYNLVNLLHKDVMVFAGKQNDEVLQQHNSPTAERVLRAARDLVHEGRFPSLLEMAQSLA